jgi:hypothetical protein
MHSKGRRRSPRSKNRPIGRNCRACCWSDSSPGRCRTPLCNAGAIRPMGRSATSICRSLPRIRPRRRPGTCNMAATRSARLAVSLRERRQKPRLPRRRNGRHPRANEHVWAQFYKIGHDRARPPGQQCAIRRAEQTRDSERYSITSSASDKSLDGISIPRALAVARLTTNSNFVGNCTGRSAGLSPLRMRSA